MDPKTPRSTRPSTNRRRWFQFSLRSILAVTLLFGVWLGLRVDRARRQREAVNAVLKAGGSVSYDYQKADASKSNVFDFKASPPGPDWLRAAVGEEHFRDVVAVSLRDKPIADEDLQQLKNFPKLENLDLSNTQVTGAGLAHLAGLTNLKFLSLWNTQVDDAGLQHLAHLEDLENLTLDGTRVTDAGLKHLENLTNLEEWLGLVDTGVTDAGVLRRLQRLTRLRNLNLRRTKVTAAGVKELRKSLREADISYGP